MTRPFTGGCACGALRYEITAEPSMAFACQCRQCQHDSGTGHASILNFPRAEAVVHGDATRWSEVGDLGTVKTHAFCPTCGSKVFTTFPDLPDFFAVRAASLDDPSRFQPTMVLWTASAQPWDRIDPELTAFEKMPPR
ncbi:GFA family protein [Siculibacillus lacustris]|uniref:GFA family protein n=1 Tax=Siculibacillus lacustris TaxID=1549641 RepID=A0A4Q9VU45_9HYPH|nr:GFA family protein [Siculibacillus lacustris]TBW38653.1 GFA family protein [Siculibacillus lacustris]